MPTCYACGMKLDGPGALLLGPPDTESRVTRRELCADCHTLVSALVDRVHQLSEGIRE